ncbi:MAG: AAA family ATPase, partial [Bifidobacteriaceae bacterium]|nr:AAA family ATPase [Bifidobacteriaceae bacterium]
MPNPPRAARPPVVRADEVSVARIAARALDRCAAARSAWTAHDIREEALRVITACGVTATPAEIRELADLATRLAVSDCWSVLPEGAARPELVAHLTNVTVLAAETRLRDALTARASGEPAPDRTARSVAEISARHGLDTDQARAAAVVASTLPLVVVEGAAGAGKTTMLGAAITTARQAGRAVRVVTPTRRAAQVAADELGALAESAAALVHAHGWRWDQDGVWTRLKAGDTDPATGKVFTGPPDAARLQRGERVVVDEAGMLDQDTALALLAIADEAGATLALVGDRAQLPAVGRGGVLDTAVAILGAGQTARAAVADVATVHRFTDPRYAALTLAMRSGDNPAELFNQLTALGLVQIHESAGALRDHIAAATRPGEAVTAATNDQARGLNQAIRAVRVASGQVEDTRTVFGADGLPIGAGDLIQTRRNDTALGVANRQAWAVREVDDDGGLWVAEPGSQRRRERLVRLPGDYAGQHAHLSYAATAYGVQGATATRSRTVLSDALGAAGLYVGMTRGR